MYKVIVRIDGYPDGQPIRSFEKNFNNKSEAIKFCEENNWENPMETSMANIYKHETKTDWFPVD